MSRRTADSTTPGTGPVPGVVDVLVLGSGIAGMCAALRAHALGLRTLVAEKTEVFGGSTALSGGLLWIPNNPLQHEAGVHDSPELALTYLDAVIGTDGGPSASPARRRAFVEHGPAMISFLRQLGTRLARCSGYSDYYTDCPGSVPEGRAVRGVPFDLHELGQWEPALRPRQLFPGVAIHMEEVSPSTVATRTNHGRAVVARIAARTITGKARRQRLETLGNGLMGQLLHLALRRGVELRRNLAVEEIVLEGGRAAGALLRSADGPAATVRARAVILACGGFAHNEAMRKEHGKQPAGTAWTLASPGDTGDGILAGQRAGGACALMDEAIWMGTATRPDGTREMHVFDRCMPHSLMVDSSGSRFVNESIDYMRFGQALYQRHRSVPNVPSWLIVDTTHRRRYGLGDAMPGITPPSWLRQGYLTKAGTLRELAARCGIDPNGLEATVARFNTMARAGRDADFGRGDTHWDRYFGDPTNRPNPNLGPVQKPPFYAVRVFPGDVGTAGGLLCDEHSRVLRNDGSMIDGLYAAGNTSASPMGPTYPGPGASIGAGAAFGYIAANHAATLTGR
jgi:3-oxosteroid 1-dehydrogenase